jgi:formylmethanofuran dehydrogenase subunit E
VVACRRCLAEKAPEHFRKNDATLCKQCHNAAYRDYSARNRERVRQQKVLSNKKHRSVLRQRAKAKASTAEARTRKAESQRAYLAANPDKFRAHWMVREAIKRGRLIKPSACERCGDHGPVEGSHTDYTQPLDVEWLCPACHRAKDWAIRRAESAGPH